MVQGMQMPPWPVSSKLTELGIGADVRCKIRPKVMGNLAFIPLISWYGQDINELLADGNPEATDSLVRLISFLAAKSYGLQVVVAPEEAKEVEYTFEAVTPRQVADYLPGLYFTEGGGMIFVRCKDDQRGPVGM